MNRKNWETYFDAVRKQNWETAKNVLQKIAAEEKNNPQVYLKLGDMYQKVGDTVQAIRSYHRSARLLRARGFSQKAIALYKIILRLDPNDGEATAGSKDVMWEIEAAKRASISDQFIPSPVSEATDKAAPVEGPVGDLQGEFSQPETSASSEEGAVSADWLQLNSYEPTEDHPMEKTESPAGLPESDAPSSPVQGGSAGVPQLFAGMSEEAFNAVILDFEIKTYSAGEKVVEEGDSGDSMYLISSGRAKVIAHLMGKEIELAELGEGDLFGEVAFLTGRPRTAEVVAAGPLKVYEINRLNIERIIENNPEVLSRLEDFYERRAKDTITKIRARPKNT